MVARPAKAGLVSTIIPVFNRPSSIAEAVDSVVAQTYRPIEVIIVNDGSTDDTGNVVERLAQEFGELVHAMHIDNSGPGAAREAGRLLAQGEFIQYLDSDDILLPDKFRFQVEGLQENPECGVAYGKTRCYHRERGPSNVAWKRTGEYIPTMFPAFLKSRWWGTSTPLYRRNVVDAAGPWLDLWNEEDWEYDSRIAAQGVHLYFCDEFVSEQRWDDNPRLSTGGSTDPRKLVDRARAHRLSYGHARHFGLDETAPEMQSFSRELFLLSRQCGAAGLNDEPEMLFNLAREAAGPERAKGLDFTVYACVARSFGWRRAGAMAHKLDALR